MEAVSGSCCVFKLLVQSGGKRRMEADENLRVTLVPPLTGDGLSNIYIYIYFCHPRNNGRRQSEWVVG